MIRERELALGGTGARRPVDRNNFVDEIPPFWAAFEDGGSTPREYGVP